MQGNAASPAARLLPKQDFLVGDWLVRPSLNLVSLHDVSTRLEPKVMQVLVCLADHAGEVIGKEELISTVWHDTFVADQVLTHAIWQLRQLFRDDPKHPQFIETIAKGGYRLTATVRPASLPEPAVVRTTESELEASASIRKRAPAIAIPRRSSWRKYASGIAVLVLAAAGTLLHFRRAPALTETDSILLADFVNTTGEPVFDDTLKQALAVQLEQSPYLNIVPEEHIRGTLRYMGRSPEEKVTGSVAREICERENVKAMLTGSIATLGSQYVIALQAVNCQTGESLVREQITVDKKETVLPAVGEAASHLRRKLGESLPSIQKFDKPIEEATTSSLEALQAFTRGREIMRRGQQVEGISYLNRAVELDPNFAWAYVIMATAYGNLNEETRSMEAMQKAYALRDRVGERERLHIDMIYHWIVTGDRDKELEAQKLFSQAYPREISPLNNLALNYSQYFGEYEKGIEAGNRVLRLSSHVAGAYVAIGLGYLGLNRVRDAKRVFEQGQAQIPGFGHRYFFMIAYLEGDQDRMLREREWAAGNIEASDLPGVYAASAAAQQGKIKESRELMTEGAETARAHNFKDLASGYIAGQALTEAEVGNFAKAREYAAASMKLSKTRTNLPTSAVALALAGDKVGAQRILNDLNRRFPEDTWINFIYGPCARAARGGSDPAEAIAGLQAAHRYELGFENRLLPIYFRGLTYLRGREATLAAAEFQRLIAHRGSSPVAPEYALAHLGLARAYLLAGDTARSRKAYEDFFALWKDADPDIPILVQAKLECAQLK